MPSGGVHSITDLSVHSAEELAAVAIALNSRPRKTLGWRTPAEALDQFLQALVGFRGGGFG
jgi:IS30 family transposase